MYTSQPASQDIQQVLRDIGGALGIEAIQELIQHGGAQGPQGYQGATGPQGSQGTVTDSRIQLMMDTSGTSVPSSYPFYDVQVGLTGTHSDGGTGETHGTAPWTVWTSSGSGDVTLNEDGTTIDINTEGTYLIRAAYQSTPATDTRMIYFSLGNSYQDLLTGWLGGDSDPLGVVTSPNDNQDHIAFWVLRLAAGASLVLQFACYPPAATGNTLDGAELEIIRLDGIVGPQGSQGVQGLPSSVPGPQGYQGSTGSGAQGYQGNQGTQGYQGLTGSGAQGAQGPQGVAGAGSAVKMAAFNGGIYLSSIPGVACMSQQDVNFLQPSNVYYQMMTVTEEIVLTDVILAMRAVGGSGCQGRVAIYNANDDWTPGTLVYDFGAIAVDSASTIDLSGLSVSLPAGNYLTRYATDANVTQPVFFGWRGSPFSGTPLCAYEEELMGFNATAQTFGPAESPGINWRSGINGSGSSLIYWISFNWDQP